MLTLQQLPYFEDCSVQFAHIAYQPWAVWLDSAHPRSERGRFDIFAADPVATIQTSGSISRITQQGVESTSHNDPFKLLSELLGPEIENTSSLPFTGGALGYFSYDLGRWIEKLPTIAADLEHYPDMAVGIYQWAVVVDHLQKEAWLTSHDCSPELLDELIRLFSQPAHPNHAHFKVLAPPVSNFSKASYAAAFERIQSYMLEGDCYQVNLTQRFSCPCEGDLWTAYQTLRRINPAPFSAYLNFPEVQILSSSPERFIQIHDRAVETKPIKGTRRRLADPELDRAQMDDLQSSSKDRAENVMIVDLLRNDIGKACRPGTVKVPEIFAIESYATVHHLVSTVVGELADEQSSLGLFKDCFPGGSITGAPKIRAMEIIEELEPHRRGVYCGSIGYIGFDGNMDSNIAIRTLIHNQGQIRFWAGGGIVRDSVMEDEYQECFDKAAAILRVLESFSQ